ncbi:protein WHAT'S THIS FACTOR 9, mitochondrial [Beta vulgaris subsp. vulgaris]|uniref:protein WHAT'S THIS FACTOR 9, mitochondrial n=1 Tax=Beta vulgaris subsp. vulgaris TaxID=3555 RepID=UPI002036C946|nr:protein WHAT'S THIS FACTOR 9, mitochondrial [Beta vulgaris subsp. vulgaris]
MVWWLVRSCEISCKSQKGYIYLQRLSLVNVKLKWVKDKVLDAAVVGQRDLKSACTLVSVISASSEGRVPIYRLRRYRGQLGLPDEVKLSTFVRRYPSIFCESSFLDSGGTPVPLFRLTPEALSLHQEELKILQQNEMDIVIRLQKLLMLVRDTTLPLHTIDQLKWDLGLPYNYHESLIPHYPETFSVVNLEDDRVGLKLSSWDSHLAVSHLQKNFAVSAENEGVSGDCLAFPIGFPRGFGLKRKCMEWLEEWQRLPYTSPYSDASHLDPRTDVSEKRIVGVFHELLHLMIQKQTERKNVSNLRKPLCLPQKFTKVFERHPSIFYISKKNDTQTVVLREAYSGSDLIEKHPLVEIRRRYAELMKQGFLDRSRGLYQAAKDI